MSDAFTLDETDDVTHENEAIAPVVRRRGRPPGSRNKPKEPAGVDSTTQPDSADAPKRRKRKTKPEDIDFATQRLIGIHQILAGFTGTPEFMLSPAEARMLAEAGIQVQKEFDIELGGKWAVLISFVGICGLIYLPRVSKFADNMKKRKRQSTVIDMPGNNDNPNN